MTKKQIIIHIVFSIVIAIVKVYQIIFIEGFWGSLPLTILKKVGFLLLTYWLVVLVLLNIKKKITHKY